MITMWLKWVNGSKKREYIKYRLNKNIVIKDKLEMLFTQETWLFITNTKPLWKNY